MATAPVSAVSTSAAPAIAPARPSSPSSPTGRHRGASATASSGALAGKTIVLDPGHNGANGDHPSVINRLVPAGRGRLKPCNTTGTATATGYSEAAFNYSVATDLRPILQAQGARVVMTRSSDTGVGPCVNRRAAIGNAARADAVIAIHADGAAPSGRGFHVIYPPDSGETAPIYRASLRLAHSVHDALLATHLLPPSTYLGTNGYSERDDLAGLNLSTQPAIFVELGNMDNPADAALQTSAPTRELFARALSRGLIVFLRAR